MAQGKSFKEQQNRYPRVRQARVNTTEIIDSILKKAGFDSWPEVIFLRAFKSERELEIWGGSDISDTLKLIRTYPFTAYCGKLGPKRRQGDLQIPEGVYYVDRFNPASSYHLSLGTNYPNRSDRIRATSPDPGGDIFIHGNRVTIGCIPIGDDQIEELYLLAVEAKNSGQSGIPVHIFPCRMYQEDCMRILDDRSTDNNTLQSFWSEIKPIYEAFENTPILPGITIDDNGVYHVK
ncbi:MAG: L,D-transpeptidase family protein [candidate division Zixibacteria bacterium]|nr:L,D-transpeptidase family protein [candidate division Zixibacteria bacterium]